MMDKDRNLTVQMEEQRPLLLDTYLIWLLQADNKKDEAAVKTSLKYLNICLDEAWFNIMLCTKEAYQSNSEHFREIAASNSLAIQVIHTQEKTIWLINFSNPSKLDLFCEQLNLYLMQCDSPCCVGIGASSDSVIQLSEPYAQADFALTFAEINRQNGLTLFASITSVSGGYYYPLDKEAAIKNHLKAGEYDKAFEIYSKTSDHNFDKKPVSLDSIRNFFYNAQSTCIKTAEELGMSYDLISQPEHIKDIRSIELCEEYIKKSYEAICCFVRENRPNSALLLAEQIYDYIEKMLINPDFSLSTIADEFNISASYVSKLFTQYKNCNFLDYINHRRIDIAKQLLTDDKMREIGEIAHSVGYDNDTTFRRIFKKYEGVTPNQFRLSNKKTDNQDSV